MPRRHYPKAREVLGCDFRGLIRPEMCKRRPVVILSYSRVRPGLAIVVPLSTTAPIPSRRWHHRLSLESQWGRDTRWAKCDMVYAVSLRRLFVWREGRDANGAPIDIRNFRIAKDDFAAIQDAVLAALNISRP